MGDDPIIPDLRSGQVAGGNNSNASSGNVYNISNFGKAGTVILVVCVGLALGLGIGAVVMMAWGQSMQRDQFTAQVAAAEKRAMDMAYNAEREARIAQDKIVYFQTELAKRGINISTDGH